VEEKNLFTKILAIVGTVLVWLPLLAPLLFFVGRIVAGRRGVIDYLMPGELFPVVLLGGGALLWAALRARSRQKLVGWTLGVAAGSLVASQGLAVVTGLASGATEPSGLPWISVLALFAVYVLSVAAMGVGGVLLVRDLFKTSSSQV